MISFRNGRGKRAFFARHELFFIFHGQVGCNLCPKKCLTTSKTVMYVCVCVCVGGWGGGVFKLKDQPGNH